MDTTKEKRIDENKKIWETMNNLLFLIDSLTIDVKELRTDVDKLIENSCGCRKSAQVNRV